MSRPVVFATASLVGSRPWEVALATEEQGARSFFVEITDTSHDDPAELRDWYARHPVGRWLSNDLTNGGMPRPGTSGSFGRNYLSQWDTAVEIVRATHGAHLVVVDQAHATALTRLVRSQRLTPAWARVVDLPTLALGWLCTESHDEADEAGLDALATPVAIAEWCDVDPPAVQTAFALAKWAVAWADAIAPYLLRPPARRERAS